MLCNLGIQQAIDDERLGIKPEPLPRRPEPGRECPYDTHSVDLRLGNEILLIIPGVFSWDLTQPGKLADFAAKNCTRVVITEHQPFRLSKNQFILGSTLEEVHFPILSHLKTCLAGRIEGKSSRARCGLLVHFTAPTVHPGFKGTITLEMINLGEVPITLTPGMTIA